MCGIAGVFEYAGAALADETTVMAMLDAIVHRGPDDCGVHVDGHVGFGTRRLSIIDVAGSRQPISNEDGTVVVAFNGEIYNYRQLRARLSRRGHVFQTNGDTEVLAHLYEDAGDDCVHELRGMFAFAIWDAKRRRMLIARDRIGIKPLYFRDDGTRLTFGSEIKALLRHPSLNAQLDFNSLAAFLLLRYVPAPGTMFEDVAAIPPGHLLACDQSGAAIRQWWDLSFAPMEPRVSQADAGERLRALLEDAIESHMMSDVPYGAFLSGGVDSSTIVALMTQKLGRPVSTFAVGYDGEGAAVSELRFAHMVAARYETDHHEVIVGAEDFVRAAEKVVWHLDQPLGDDACVPTYLVSELAHKSVKMVLTGEGADELFGGYARYTVESRIAPVAARLPSPVQSMMSSLSRRRPGLTRAQIALYALSQRDESARLALYTPLMHPEARAELAACSLEKADERVTPAAFFARDLERTDAAGPLHRMLYVDTGNWLPDMLLARGDKTSMAASIEARVPFLDHPLVEFAAALPAGLKIHGARQIRKYLLREVAKDLLPAPILSRAKKGFPVPISMWLRSGAREFYRELLSPEAVARRGLFRPERMARLLDDHDSGAADHGTLIWGLMSLELWHRRYLDRSQRPLETRRAP
jgi:asparagine synthase (glutamine-hydrolysing)